MSPGQQSAGHVDGPPADGPANALPRLWSTAQQDTVRVGLYREYARTHAGIKNAEGEKHVFRRDILPHLPTARNSHVLDVGCGQGELVTQLVAHGYINSRGIDISPEQVAIARQKGLDAVDQGDLLEHLRGVAGSLDCVIATDLLEHLRKPEVVEAMRAVHSALRPRGVFIARSPNGVSPFAGNFRYGDFTHETAFTASSFHQVMLNAGFSQVVCYPCPPVAHGWKSGARALLWRGIGGTLKLALLVETGIRGHIVTQNLVAVARKE